MDPQGVQVVPFKQPTSKERDYDFLGALTRMLPRAPVSRSTTVRTMRMCSLCAFIELVSEEVLEPRYEASSGSLIGRQLTRATAKLAVNRQIEHG
jgi:hypothetical protein